MALGAWRLAPGSRVVVEVWEEIEVIALCDASELSRMAFRRREGFLHLSLGGPLSSSLSPVCERPRPRPFRICSFRARRLSGGSLPAHVSQSRMSTGRRASSSGHFRARRRPAATTDGRRENDRRSSCIRLALLRHSASVEWDSCVKKIRRFSVPASSPRRSRNAERPLAGRGLQVRSWRSRACVRRIGGARARSASG